MAEAACASLAPVGTYAAASAKALTQLASMPSDAKASCRRTVASDLSSIDMVRIPTAPAIDSTCAVADSSYDVAAHGMAVVTAYYTMLASLVDDNLVSYDPALDSVAKALGTWPRGGKLGDRAAAVTKTIDVLARAVTDHYRRREIGEFVQTVTPRIDTVAVAIDATVSAYALDLEREKVSLQGRFAPAISRDPRSAAAAVARELWDSRQAALDVRIQAIADLHKAVDALQKGNAVLYQQRHQLRAKDVEALLGPYASALNAAAQALAKVR